ncbi:hypothetical protein [Novosphingobium sp.]|uniref:hypothetical protein n=1 Tax=Novosphingobium sp. TaxID=1874826 RepID=UPI00286AD7D4|nr:hypothetical protein [Novosphingobium sp.]
MNPFKLIAGFVRWLWQASMLLRYPFDSGLRTGSRAAGLYMFLVQFFLVVGVILVAFGFDLDQIDRSLDARSSWIDWAASLLFRIFSALVYLLSLAFAGMMVATLLFKLRGQPAEVGVAEPDEEDAEETPAGAGSLGCGLLAALTIAYFSWFGIVG